MRFSRMKRLVGDLFQMTNQSLKVNGEVYNGGSFGFNRLPHQPNHEVLEIVIASRFD